MATKRNAAKSKKALSVDFSDTEASGVVEEGDYLIELDEVEQKTSESSGADYLSLEFKIVEGDFKGKKLWHNCSLQPQALFNLRGVLEALGFEVPTGVMELDPADLIGSTCGASVTHEVYEGKTKARIAEFFSAEELGGEEAVEEPVAPAKKGPAKKATEPEPAAPSKKKKVTKAAEPEIEVGSMVTFTDDDGEELSGKVTAVDGDTATVKVGKEEWELDLGDLTLA